MRAQFRRKKKLQAPKVNIIKERTSEKGGIQNRTYLVRRAKKGEAKEKKNDCAWRGGL